LSACAPRIARSTKNNEAGGLAINRKTAAYVQQWFKVQPNIALLH